MESRHAKNEVGTRDRNTASVKVRFLLSFGWPSRVSVLPASKHPYSPAAEAARILAGVVAEFYYGEGI